MPFTLLPEEWEKALAFFRANPNAIKYSKKVHHVSHSFIKLMVDNKFETDDIFAISNEKTDKIPILGMGGFARVKIVKNHAEQEFALKVEGEDSLILWDDRLSSLKVARMVNFFKGQNLRILDKPTRHMEKTVLRKHYSLLELIKGKNLFSIIRRHENVLPLTDLQLHLIGLVCAIRLLRLHQKRIIHGDIKAENYVGQVHGNNIDLFPVDYDFSLLLSEGQSVRILDFNKGSLLYAAPEMLSNGEYSFASDIYALGVIFRYLELSSLSQEMTRVIPEARPILPCVISNLIGSIFSNGYQLDEEATKIIAEGLEVSEKPIAQYLRSFRTLAELQKNKILSLHFSFEERLVMAVGFCVAVLLKHNQKKIVINIRPQDFKVCVNEDGITCQMKFYNENKNLNSKDAYLVLNGINQPHLDEYSAPESKQKLIFSYASDVYSLGFLLKELGLEPGQMLAVNSQERPSLEEAINQLIGRYEMRCDEAVKGYFKKIRALLPQGNTSLHNKDPKHIIPLLNMAQIDTAEPLSAQTSPDNGSSASLSPLSTSSLSPLLSPGQETARNFSITPPFSETIPSLSQLEISSETPRSPSLLSSWLNFKKENPKKEKKDKEEKKDKVEKKDKP